MTERLICSKRLNSSRSVGPLMPPHALPGSLLHALLGPGSASEDRRTDCNMRSVADNKGTSDDAISETDSWGVGARSRWTSRRDGGPKRRAPRGKFWVRLPAAPCLDARALDRPLHDPSGVESGGQKSGQMGRHLLYGSQTARSRSARYTASAYTALIVKRSTKSGRIWATPGPIRFKLAE